MPEMSSPFDSFPEPLSIPESVSSPNGVTDWQTRYARMVALQATSTRLFASLDWDTLLAETLEAVRALFRADGVTVIMPQIISGELYIAKSHHVPDEVVQTWHTQTEKGVIGWVAQHRQPLLLTSAAQVAQYGSVPHDQISSSMVMPILLPPGDGSDPFLGVLTISRQFDRLVFNQADVEQAEAFCAQLAVALRNAQNYRQAQLRVVQSNTLNEISRALISTLDVDQVLRTLMIKAVELLRSESGSLLLIDEATQELVFKVAVGPASEIVIGTRLPQSVGIVGAVAMSGKPLIVNNAKADPRHYGKVDATTDLKTQMLLCAPLINKGKILGVIEVINRQDGKPFDDDDLQLLSTYATQGTIALENAQLYTQLKQLFTDTVRVIANAVEARDPYTAGHTLRVTHLAIEIAREMGWSSQQREWLEIGALLHDIGKVGIPDLILRKPSGLTDDEYSEMKRHPIVGVKMLEGVAALRPVLPYILYHQERYDGKGYPFGLSKNEIPIEGRLLAVVDTFDAMTSDRPYRKGLSDVEALDEIQRNRGTQFDPDIVDAFVRVKQREDSLTPLPGDA